MVGADEVEKNRTAYEIKTLKQIIHKLVDKIEELAPEAEENEELITWALNWARE